MLENHRLQHPSCLVRFVGELCRNGFGLQWQDNDSSDDTMTLPKNSRGIVAYYALAVRLEEFQHDHDGAVDECTACTSDSALCPEVQPGRGKRFTLSAVIQRVLHHVQLKTPAYLEPFLV